MDAVPLSREAGLWKRGVLWLLRANEPLDVDADERPGATLLRWQLEGKKTETLFRLSHYFGTHMHAPSEKN